MTDAAIELERLAEELQYQYACDKAQQEEIKRLSALAQSNAEPRQNLRLEEDAQGKRAVLGGYQMPDALIPSLEAQSNAEPVACQKVREVLEAARLCLKSRDQSPHEARVREAIESILYTVPPRPDASAGQMTEELKFGPVPAAYCVALSWSGFNVYGDRKSIDAVRDMMRPDASAGLIEAAEWHEGCVHKYNEQLKKIKGDDILRAIRDEHQASADHFRARAADRIGK